MLLKSPLFLGDILARALARFKAAGRGRSRLGISGQIIHLVSFPSNLYEDYQKAQFRRALMAGPVRRSLKKHRRCPSNFTEYPSLH